MHTQLNAPVPPMRNQVRPKEVQTARRTAPEVTKPSDDLALLEGIHAGDGNAWRTLHLRWHPFLLSCAKAILRSPDLAEDAASEAILQIHRRASHGSFPHDPNEATRWIQKQGRNCALRQRGSASVLHLDRIDRLVDRDEDDSHAPYDAGTDARYLRIEKAMRHLPARAATAVSMHYFDRLSFRRIAALQGGTVAGARNRVERGILRIVVVLHSRKRGGLRAENAADLSLEDRARVRNTVAAMRARDPGIGLRWLSAEVCRATGIYIHPESDSAGLLANLHYGRIQ
jgi:RNA polymerase sigma factor (sigma-70 family)